MIIKHKTHSGLEQVFHVIESEKGALTEKDQAEGQGFLLA